ncbi:hypothetical protein SAY87_028960 [Trapa incisa]|uniref:Peptidase A1 domain-containing protein n=1 Tax=Trapa incisa TaxID=236973 RepID=A0AAN7QQL0_9MYRT|nr:hypothetical protein SAY87_028960 [Trapa incisa]
MPQSTSSHFGGSLLLWAMSLAGVWLGAVGSSAGGKFSFSMHHRYSQPVKGMLPSGLDGLPLPEEGTVDYYRAMVHRDWEVHPGRRLSSRGGDGDGPPLTFANGNDTYRISSLGFLQYANVTVGTPSLSFLVALDTGSDLFWLPCDCISCVWGLKTSGGQEILFNMYSPTTSSTGSAVPCNSASCRSKHVCVGDHGNCPYQVIYASNGTSSTGVLVNDFLHLVTDDDQGKLVDANITFGCGRIQTGSFLKGGPPNGLLGLGMTDISVPSILASQGLISNSFSMCFGSKDIVGRISFGDKGSPAQGETTFNLGHSHPFYNITITGINVNGTADIEFTAIFDSGTSITHLMDPAYTLISESFNSRAKDKRRPWDPSIPFEYCYELSPNQNTIEVEALNLTMRGGDVFSIKYPLALVSLNDSTDIYCLAMVRDDRLNIIGQNFMKGYRIVFDRERMVLGWKDSDCYSAEEDVSQPETPLSSAPVLAPTPIGPGGFSNQDDGLRESGKDQPANGSWKPCPSIFILVISLCPILAVF